MNQSWFVTPKRHDLDFRFTLIPCGLDTEECIYWLTEIHRYYRHKVIMVWDNLSAHLATESFFETEHPDWFEFFNFPTYSPELNPVEQCWRQMKHVYLCNFVPTSEVELKSAVFSAAMRINEEHLLSSFFKHAGVKL